MANVLDAFVRFLADTKDVDAALDQRIPGQAGQSGQKAGTAFSNALNKAAVAGAAGGVVFASAIEGATAFEDQLRTINTVAKLTDDQLNDVGSSILDLSRETGKTTDDLTAGFYDLVSAGIPADQAIKTLRSSAILATGALGTTGEAVDLVTSALGAYGLDASEATKVTDIFAQAVADGKTTVADLAGGISTIAPIAAAAGVSLEEVAAATAIMTLKGDSASQAMTRIRASISALLTPNETLNKISERTGINFAKLAEDQGLTVALGELRKATEGNNEEFAKALGSAEALTFAFATTGDGAAAMEAELLKVEEAAGTGGVALGQYEEAQKSAAAEGRRMTAAIKAFLIEVGGPFVQTLGPALQTLNLLGPAFGRGGIAAKAFGGALGLVIGKGIKPLIAGLKGLIGPGFFGVDGAESGIATVFRKVKDSSVVKAAVKVTGQALGKALGVAVGAGNALASGVATGLEALKSSPVVGKAMSTAGKAAGTTFGKAFGVAAAAAAVVGVVFVAKEVSEAIDKQKAELLEQAKEFSAVATTEALKASRAGVEEQLKKQLSDFAMWSAIPMGLGGAMAKANQEAAAGTQAVLDTIDSELAAREVGLDFRPVTPGMRDRAHAQASEVGDAIADGIGGGAEDAETRVDRSADEILTSIRGLRDALLADAQGVADALYDPILKAAELAETQQELAAVKAKLREKNLTDDQIKELNRRRQELGKILITQTAEILTYGTQAEQISKTKAFLASSFWVQAYQDATPEQRLALDEWRTTLETRLNEMVVAAEEKGGDLRDKYTGEISDGRDDVTKATKLMTGGADSAFEKAERNAYTYGKNTGQEYADGLRAKEAAVRKAAANLAAGVEAFIRVNSPAKEGPLSQGGGPGGWGGRISDLVAEGIRGGIGELIAASSEASEGIASGFGAYGASPSINPALGTLYGGSGRAVGRSGMGAAAAPVEKHVHYEPHITGLLKARDPLEVAYAMERVRDTGLVARTEEDWQ